MTREEAIDVLKHNYPSACFTDLYEAVEIAIQALSAQPERKKGKWVGKGSEGFGIFICDNCGKLSMMEYDFCPNCGCRMEEGDK